MLAYPKNFEGSITILGEKGTVRVGGVAVNEIQHWEFAEPHSDDETVKQASYQTASVYGFGYPLYYDNVIKVLRGEAEPETEREGLKSLEVLIATYLSARDGRRVALVFLVILARVRGFRQPGVRDSRTIPGVCGGTTPACLVAGRARRRSSSTRGNCFVPLTVALELEWVLRGVYELAPEKVAESFNALLGVRNLHFEREAAVLEAVRRWRTASTSPTSCTMRRPETRVVQDLRPQAAGPGRAHWTEAGN